MSKVFKTIDPRHITIRSFEANKSFKKIPTKEIKNITKEIFVRSYF